MKVLKGRKMSYLEVKYYWALLYQLMLGTSTHHHNL